jgi:hypothetical protein
MYRYRVLRYDHAALIEHSSRSNLPVHFERAINPTSFELI